jgi:glycosyltransferase involved in cell wall biosynthesis
MPVHNAAGTLRISIRSTLFAMPQNSELLIGLHDCTDQSAEIVGEFLDTRIRVFTHSGGGLSTVLNQLVAESRGDFIARMDADDVCLPWRFIRQFRVLESKQADVVFGTAVLFGWILPPPHIFLQYLTRLTSDKFGLALIFICPAVHPSMLARREILEFGPPYQEKSGEDLDLWLRLVLKGTSIYRDWFPALLYRSHASQLSRHEEYLKGWLKDYEILDYRRKVLNQLLLQGEPLLPGPRSFISFCIRHPLISLEILGLPTVAKVRNFYRTWDSQVRALHGSAN